MDSLPEALEASLRDSHQPSPSFLGMDISSKARIEILKRSSQRVTISISDRLCRRLNEQADLQGRSLSNLCAYLLEVGADQHFPIRNNHQMR